MKTFAEKLRDFEEAYPFKRVEAPQYLIDKFNKQFPDQVTKEMAFTVKKGVDVTDQEIWEQMLKMNDYALVAQSGRAGD